ncbi:MAG: ABC transporter ATP-binding protein [Muribaculaceae bacterium]
MSHAIVIDGVSKRYGAVQALDGISLEVPKGSLYGLIGPDGAGKSSLYRILTTLAQADAGTATVVGLDVRCDARTLRTRLGYMPERFSLYPDLSVSENLEFFASLFGVRVKDNYDIIAPIYSQLSRFPNRRAGALSGGMKQKLALCCALIHRPEVLLLDEPTTGVDAVSRSEFWDTLATLRDSGITIMASTSYMDEAERCDTVALIDHGHILDIDTPEHLADKASDCLYSVSADRMYDLLKMLREIPGVDNCYTFGASHHITTTANISLIERELQAAGATNVKISPCRGNIEDLFIKLMSNE